MRTVMSILTATMLAMIVWPDPARAQAARGFELSVGYQNLLNQRVTSSDVSTVNGLTPSQVQAILGADVTTSRGHAGLNGFTATVTKFFSDQIGVSGAVTANLKTESAVFFGLPGTDRTRVYQFLAGPAWRLAPARRIVPFAEALAGVARFSGTYTNPVASVIDRQTAFAVAVGGGVDVRAGRHLRLRTFQIDYNPLLLRRRDVADSNGVPFDLKGVRRDNVRLSFGIVVD